MNASSIQQAPTKPVSLTVSRLQLRDLTFQRVEFELAAGAHSRSVVVRVGSGSSWLNAVRFPTIGTDATETTGDDELDAAIRARAAEELVRLEVATLAASDRRLVA